MAKRFVNIVKYIATKLMQVRGSDARKIWNTTARLGVIPTNVMRKSVVNIHLSITNFILKNQSKQPTGGVPGNLLQEARTRKMNGNL